MEGKIGGQDGELSFVVKIKMGVLVGGLSRLFLVSWGNQEGGGEDTSVNAYEDERKETFGRDERMLPDVGEKTISHEFKYDPRLRRSGGGGGRAPTGVGG